MGPSTEAPSSLVNDPSPPVYIQGGSTDNGPRTEMMPHEWPTRHLTDEQQSHWPLRLMSRQSRVIGVGVDPATRRPVMFGTVSTSGKSAIDSTCCSDDVRRELRSWMTDDKSSLQTAYAKTATQGVVEVVRDFANSIRSKSSNDPEIVFLNETDVLFLQTYGPFEEDDPRFTWIEQIHPPPAADAD